MKAKKSPTEDCREIQIETQSADNKSKDDDNNICRSEDGRKRGEGIDEYTKHGKDDDNKEVVGKEDMRKIGGPKVDRQCN